MKISRRTFLKRATATAIVAGVGGTAYGVGESGWITVSRQQVTIPKLPPEFVGKRVAFLSDIHHGPFIGLRYVERVVEQTNSLVPDVICLGGDYIYTNRRYIRPCLEALGQLRAPLGVYGVLGNHEHYHAPLEARRCLDLFGIGDLNNAGVWLKSGDARLRLCGIDDLWMGKQDLEGALGGAHSDETSLLLSHNPDFAEMNTDQRVGLILSGHTHGGQICLPFYGPAWIPSRYGHKYAHGLVQAPHTQIFVSRGVGLVDLPLRVGAPPEVVLITLS